MQCQVTNSRDSPSAHTNCAYVNSAIEPTQTVVVTTPSGAKFFINAKWRQESGCQIELNGIARTWMRVSLTDTVLVENCNPQPLLSQVHVNVQFLAKRNNSNVTITDQTVHDVFADRVVTIGQTFITQLNDKTVTFTICKIADGIQTGCIGPCTIVVIATDCPNIDIAVSGQRVRTEMVAPALSFEPSWDLTKMGIGGLDREMESLFRRAFVSRLAPPQAVQKLNLRHVMGVLLHGPPGTGKTTIARAISKMLKTTEPKIVNGPEILSKWVGEAEQRIRDLFADATKDQAAHGPKSPLHVIIFDELDAVCKRRDGASGKNTDSVVNQLLANMDGVNRLSNLLIFGLTNRLDMIDDALLRPGRFEVHLEIGLPDEAGRSQILNIHASALMTNGKIAPNVDFAEIAREAKNFSGAEIEGLVRCATSHAMNRTVNYGDGNGDSQISLDPTAFADMVVKREDFVLALAELKPTPPDFELILSRQFVPWHPYLEASIGDAREWGQRFLTSRLDKFCRILHGPAFSGKTTLACHIAKQVDFTTVRMVRPDDYVGSEGDRCAALARILAEIKRCEASVLILDNVEELIGLAPGPRFLPNVLQAIITLLRTTVRHHTFVIVTSCMSRQWLEEFGIAACAHQIDQMPLINSKEQADRVLSELGQPSSDSDELYPVAIGRVLTQGFAPARQ